MQSSEENFSSLLQLTDNPSSISDSRFPNSFIVFRKQWSCWSNESSVELILCVWHNDTLLERQTEIIYIGNSAAWFNVTRQKIQQGIICGWYNWLSKDYQKYNGLWKWDLALKKTFRKQFDVFWHRQDYSWLLLLSFNFGRRKQGKILFPKSFMYLEYSLQDLVIQSHQSDCQSYSFQCSWRIIY